MCNKTRYNMLCNTNGVQNRHKVKGHLTFTYVIPSVISQEDNPAKRKFLVKTYEIKVLESQE
ncbi:hypothetical protein ESCO106042_22995 [Escherichia coli]